MENIEGGKLLAVHRRVPRSGRQVFFVDWNLGNACHYACSYCPKRLHDGSAPGPQLDKALEFCEWVAAGAKERDLDLHLHFSGGEPTIYDEFEPLVAEIAARGLATMSLVSNGARPLSWWTRVGHFFKAITLSCHVEYVRMDRFEATARILSGMSDLHVNVPAPPERFEECLGLFEHVLAEVPGATATLKPILKGFSESMADYSEQQLDVLRNQNGQTRRAAPPDRDLGVLNIVTLDGTITAGSASALLAKKLNCFQGWDCAAGVESLAILLGGEIFRAVCKEGGRLGVIDGPLPVFPRQSLTCGKRWCKCLTDIQISKQAQRGAIWLHQP